MRNAFFGRDIEPACCYCLHGEAATASRMILCPHTGVVEPYYKCWRFRYDPLMRVPRPLPELPVYRPEDFEL